MHDPVCASFTIGRRAQALALVLVLAATTALAAPKKPVRKSQEPAPLDVPIAIDGPGVHVDAKKPGRLVRLKFRAQAGERLGLGLWSIDLKPESMSTLLVEVRGPDGHVVPQSEPLRCLAETDLHPVDGCGAEFTTQATGWHVIDVDTPFSATAQFKVALSRPAVAKLAIDHEQTVAVKRVGQAARFELPLASGSEATITARDATPGRGGSAFALRVFRADGTIVAQTMGIPSLGATLQVKGEGAAYRIEIEPVAGKPGDYLVSARSVRGLVADGPPLEFSTTGPNEVVRFGMQVKAGEVLAIGVEGLAHNPDPDNGVSRFTVRKPDGGQLKLIGCMTHATKQSGPYVPPCKMVTPRVPETGRYTVELAPPMDAMLSGRLFAITAITGTLTPGSPVHIPSMKPGQVARYTFSANAGQRVAATITDLATAPEGTKVGVWIAPEQGYGLVSMYVAPAKVEIQKRPIPATGTYTVMIDPGFGSVQSGELTLELQEGKPQ